MAMLSNERFAAIDRYAANYGVIDFTLFEDFDGTLIEQQALIVEHFQRLGIAVRSSDEEFLGEVRPDLYDRGAFLGDWYDSNKGKLILVGDWTLDDGRTINSLAVEELDKYKVRSGGFGLPALGARGQFAYAFYKTPYGLREKGAVAQALFDGLWATISPPGSECEYFDWSSAELGDHFVPYFQAGAEWWGTFLYTIHDHTLQRLWVMSASTTD